MSPVTLRRQADRLGTGDAEERLHEPQGRGVVEHLGGQEAPFVKGDMRMHGTRKPRPTGPAMPPAVGGQRVHRQVFPGVPAGGTGGGT